MMKKKKLLIGGIVIACIILVLDLIIAVSVIKSKINSTEKNIKEYCDILVEGNYADILDLVYFPKSEFITKEKIDELKPVFFEKMKEENNDIVECTYTEANETGDILTYKLVMETSEGQATRSIEVRKKDGKIILDGLYMDRTIEVFKDSQINIDDIELTRNPEYTTDEGNQVAIYEVTLLMDVPYDIKVTHPVFKDAEMILEGEDLKKVIDDTLGKLKDDDIIDFTAYAQDNLSEKYEKEIESDILDGCKDIVKVALEKGDISKLNKYFLNSDAEKFVNDDEALNGTMVANYENKCDMEFKGVSSSSLDQLEYINENELKINVIVVYLYNMVYKNTILIGGDENNSMVQAFDGRYSLHCIKDGDNWKISDWDED